MIGSVNFAGADSIESAKASAHLCVQAISHETGVPFELHDILIVLLVSTSRMGMSSLEPKESNSFFLRYYTFFAHMILTCFLGFNINTAKMASTLPNCILGIDRDSGTAFPSARVYTYVERTTISTIKKKKKPKCIVYIVPFSGNCVITGMSV